MTRTIHQIEIDRVVVTGAGTEGLQAGELRALIEQAVARGLAEARLPAGRTVRSAVQVNASSLKTGRGVADAVAAGVARAVSGGSSRG